MDATPFDIGDARPLAAGIRRMGITTPAEDSAVALTRAWSAIHEAAATVGAIAGLMPVQVASEIERGCLNAPRSGEGTDGQCIRDLAEIMRCGISALLTAHTSGGSPQAAAASLWREFIAARDEILEPGSRGNTTGRRS